MEAPDPESNEIRATDPAVPAAHGAGGTRRGHQLRRLLRRVLAGAGSCAVLLLCGLAFAILCNNYSLRQMSRVQFDGRVNQAIEASTKWMTEHDEIFANPSLMFMVTDMASLSGDPRLRQITERYLHSKFVNNPGDPFSAVWARIIDRHAPVPVFDLTWIPAGDSAETLWDAYAVAPDRVLISSAQRASMFSATKFYWGKRQHQLLALDMYRYYNGDSGDLRDSINQLAEKVARDAHFDFRVNDAYPQRSAFVLGAHRPDLIRPRWIERLLDYQHADGSWSYCWYGWCRGIAEFGTQESNAGHTTVQAAWALYMLKYRFPLWARQHFE